MPINWSPFVDLVRSKQRFLLTTHVRPDADGLGSMLGLAMGLEQLGKITALLISSVFPSRYRFLDPQERISNFSPPGDEWRNADVVIVLDTGTWSQLGTFGPFMQGLQVPKIVIDHHLTQDDLGAERFVDTSAEATGRLAHEALTALHATITPTIADALFAALATDTGWFRHNNTSTNTFLLAAELQKAGASPTRLFDGLYEQNSLARLRLTGLALDRLQTSDEGQIAFTEVRREDYTTTGAVPQDSEDLITYTRSISGVEIGLIFMEQPRGGVKVSFRARSRIDVSRVAEQFGGGGHKFAAGATINSTLEDARTRVLEAVRAALRGEE